jgi:hypothetical protein
MDGHSPDKDDRRVVTEGVMVVAAMFGVMILVGFGGLDWLQASFCPAGTLVAGHVFLLPSVFLLISIMALVAGIPMAWMGGSIRRFGKRDAETQRRAKTVGRVGWGLLAFSLAAWPFCLSYYYCATPTSIRVHPGIFGRSVSYSWSDVGRVSISCHGWHRPEFELYMGSGLNSAPGGPGQSIGLGGDSWPQLARNYAQVSAALSSVPFIYDTSRIQRCSAKLAEFFAVRPGSGYRNSTQN